MAKGKVTNIKTKMKPTSTASFLKSESMQKATFPKSHSKKINETERGKLLSKVEKSHLIHS